MRVREFGMQYWIHLSSSLNRIHPTHLMKENLMNVKKFFQAALAISALFIGLANPAQATIKTWTGDTTGGPTLDLTPWEFENAEAVAYSAFTFTVDADGAYTFLLTAEYDSVVLLYQTPFDPADTAGATFINGNDDELGTTTSGIAADLEVGTSYTFVITGYDNSEAGFYSLTVGGPGNLTISPVPEPSTWLMLAFGLAAITYAQRRKSLR
jgi:hypothetical protein